MKIIDVRAVIDGWDVRIAADSGQHYTQHLRQKPDEKALDELTRTWTEPVPPEPIVSEAERKAATLADAFRALSPTVQTYIRTNARALATELDTLPVTTAERVR